MAATPRRFAAQLTPAERIDQVFLISQPQLRTTSRGDYYIAAFLSDRSGRLNGRMWQASETIYNSLPEEGFVHVRGRTENYQNALQLVIESLRPVDIKDVNVEDFMPSTDKDVEQMFARVREIVAAIKNRPLARLVKAFLDDAELMRKFRIAPAAIALHHAYLGGLLEHTLSLLELGLRVLPHYPELDGDLVLAGLFLHDIGKTTELDFDISFKYSDQGRLMGHLVKGAILIEQKISELNAAAPEPFPRLLADCLQHIIVSHHGQREFGCPVLPATPEAYAVHYLDNLDSKLALTMSEIKKDGSPSNWTTFVKALDSALFKVRPPLS
jgi:3'-5' exoribonuclease